MLQRRVLGVRTLRARYMHRCDNCDQPIFPGDLYSVVVEVRTRMLFKWLWVRKEHESPKCPYPEDEPDEERNVIPFKLAA